MSGSVPSWMSNNQGDSSAVPAPPAAPDVNTPRRPVSNPPSVKIVKQRIKSNKVFYFQGCNVDGDVFFTETVAGDSFWLLPVGVPVSRIRYISHSTDAGVPYYESLKTKAVTWQLPEEGVSEKAAKSIKMLTKMNRAQCNNILKDTFSDEDMMHQLDLIDQYAAELDEGIQQPELSDEEVEIIEHDGNNSMIRSSAKAVPADSQMSLARPNGPPPGPPGAMKPPGPPRSTNPSDYYDPGTPRTEPGTPVSPLVSPNSGRSLPTIPGQGTFASANLNLTPTVASNKAASEYYDPGTPLSPAPIEIKIGGPTSPAPAPGDARTSVGPGSRPPDLNADFDNDEEGDEFDEHGYTGDDPGRKSSRLSVVSASDSGSDRWSGTFRKATADAIADREAADNGHPTQGLISGFMVKQPVRKAGVNNKDDNTGEWKRRYFVLSPMVLTYYVDYTEIESQSVKPQGEVQIFPHTMVQKCAAEANAGGQEFIFRLLNSVTGESIRMACASESTRERWMQCILNAANNLQGKGFMADTFGCYGSLLTGYKKKYFILAGNSLHRFASDKTLSYEEEHMSINKKTRMERVEESKGRFVLINATGSDGPAKYQLQLDTTGVPKSQFQLWLSAFQAKIQAGHMDDTAELHVTFHNANDAADSDGSDKKTMPDVLAPTAPTQEGRDKKKETDEQFAAQHPHLRTNSTPVLKPGEMPSRPSVGPPPVTHALEPMAAQPVELDFFGNLPDSRDNISTASALAPAPTPAPAPAVLPEETTPEMDALKSRLAELEAEAKEREVKKAAKALAKSSKLLGISAPANADSIEAVPLALQSKKKPGSPDHPSKRGGTTAGNSATAVGATTTAPTEAKKVGKSEHTKAFLDAMYGSDSEEDEKKRHKAAASDETKKHESHHKHHHHHHKHHKEHKHGEKDKNRTINSADSRRLSLFDQYQAAAGGGSTSTGGGSPRSNMHKPFAHLLFDKYCNAGEETLDVRGIQRLYYDHGFFKPLDQILQSMWGIGDVHQHTVFNSAKFDVEDFAIWYRVKGTMLNELKLSYTDSQDTRSVPSLPFFNRIKVCMLFRAHDALSEFEDLKGYLDQTSFRQLHEQLLDEALIEYVMDEEDNDREREPTCKESIENILQIAEHQSKVGVHAKINLTDKRRVSSAQKIFLEDYVTWMSEFGIEQITSFTFETVEAPKNKGLASKTRNLLRGVFGIKKAAKPPSTQAVMGTVYDNNAPLTEFHADNTHFPDTDRPSDASYMDDNDDGEEDADRDGSASHHVPRFSANTKAHASAMALYNEGISLGVVNEEDSSDDTDATEEVDIEASLKRHQHHKNDPDFEGFLTDTDTSGEQEPVPEPEQEPEQEPEPDSAGLLPTSEDLYHHIDGPIHGDKEHIYKALNDSEESRAVTNAFSDAFGGEVTATVQNVAKPVLPVPGPPVVPEKLVPPSPPAAVAAPAQAAVPAPAEKPLSALERMVQAKAKSAPPGPPASSASPRILPGDKAARPVSTEFHEPVAKKAMTLKEKMAAAVEARKRQKELQKDGDINTANAAAANTAVLSAAFADSDAHVEPTDADARDSALLVAPLPPLPPSDLASSGSQPSPPVHSHHDHEHHKQQQHHRHHSSVTSNPADLTSKNHRSSKQSAIEVSNNSVSWGVEPQKNGASAFAEPVYSKNFMFDEYSSGVAPVALDIATPIRRTGYVMPKSNQNTGQKSTKQKLQQTKTSASKVTGGFFAPSQRKVVTAFRPVVGETDLGRANNVAMATPSSTNPPKSALTAAELAVLQQLGLDSGAVNTGEEWERKGAESGAPVGEEWERRAGLTPIAVATPGPGIPPPPATPKGHASFLFTPQTAHKENKDTAEALLSSPGPGRARRSSVTTFAGVSGADTVCRAVQTGDSGVGQSYIIAGFEGKHKHKHKHSKQVQLLKAEMTAAAAAKAEADAQSGDLVANAREEELSQHVPKSAFHLILGERYAVDDMWIRVREEEEKIARELEQAEEDAADRIRNMEMESLLKVQYAWSERHAWQAKAQNELSIAQFAVDQETRELDERRNDAANAHKQRTMDFASAYALLQTHHHAIEKERLRLNSKQIRSGMENAMLMLQLKESQRELIDLLRQSKEIHAQHLLLDREVATNRQKRLPHYMQHGSESDRFVEALEQGGISGYGVGVTSPTDAAAHVSHISRPLFANATNANSIEKPLVFHKYDHNSVKISTHTAAQAKESRRRASVSTGSSADSGYEVKGEMNFRSKEHEEHLKKYQELYGQHPETHDHLKVPTRKTIDDLTPAQVLARQERAERARLEKVKNQGPLSMAVKPVTKGATKGKFLKRGQGTGGTTGKQLAQHWKASTEDHMPATKDPVYQPPPAQMKKPHYATQKSDSGSPSATQKLGGLPFSPEIYTGMDTRVEAPKDHRGHYDIGMIVHQNKYVPLHSRRSPSPKAMK